MSYPGYPGYPPQGGANAGYPPTNQQYPPNTGPGYPTNPGGGFPQPSNPGYPAATGGTSYPGYPGYPSSSPAPGYGAQPQPPYGAPAAYGAPPQPAYGAPPQPAYGAPVASYGAQPQPGYGAPPVASYGAQPHGAQPHGAQPQYSHMAPAPAPPQNQIPHQSPYTNNANMNAGAHNTSMSGAPDKGTPTLRPFPGFNARQDAEALRKAMKGIGTNEKAIIAVLAKRTNAQRLEIAAQYKTLHGKDLMKDLKSELNGSFEQLVIAMMTPLTQYYAQELKEAVSGIGTDEAAVIEILCTLNNSEIRTICAAYQTLYRNSLEKDLMKDTSGNFKRLMVSLCNASRDESNMVDPSACAQDAQSLLAAGKLKFGTDESTFNAILCSRSFNQLRQIFADYERLAGHPIEKSIQNEFSGDIEKGLLAIVKSVRYKPAFFAERLHASLAGMGTKDRTLIRIVVTRCEIDMGDIKQEFQVRYKGTLEKFISGDASGDYKNCLIALTT